MNEYDSDKISDVLRAAEGLELTPDPAQADVIVFNTCSVREKAQEKVFSDLGRVRHLEHFFDHERIERMLFGVAAWPASSGERCQLLGVTCRPMRMAPHTTSKNSGRFSSSRPTR